ncbi:MAG: hypothetical protein GWN86_20530, partial [Desulfobacterales bacterium]|nr:hypothetical protein [Desulfobacterales bacterium]
IFSDRVVFDEDLDPGDIFEFEHYGDAFPFTCEIDPNILRIPVLQDGIDEDAEGGPTVVLREGIDYFIVEQIGKKFLSSNTD